MRIFMKKPLAAATLVSATAMIMPVHAQEKKAPAEITVRMLAFTPDLQFPEAHAWDPERDDASVPAPIKSYLNHESSKVKTSSRKLVFTFKADRESITRAGELIGEVTLPEKTNSALLIFFPTKAGGDAKCRIVAFDDSKKAFPAGSFQTANISSLPARVTLEDKDYDLAAEERLLIENPPMREGKVSGMRAHVQNGGAWKEIATGMWQDPGGSRSLKIFFQNPTTEKVTLRSFDDVPPREPEKAAESSKKSKKAKKR